MTPLVRNLIGSLLKSNLVGKSTMSPSEWCRENLNFDEPNNHGPFRIAGAEYIRDVLDDFSLPDVSDIALVWGSQTRKTGTLMGGLAWSVVNDPCGVLWVMPNETLCRRFSRQRWQKLLRASSITLGMIPKGAERHTFSSLEQIIGGSIINFVGSNSAANLASFPCRRVIMDEVDKFNEGGAKETDAANLAEQRTKDQTNPQRWRTSTPTLSDGLIWQSYLKGNQCRYVIPCPHCTGDVVLAWEKGMTVLALTGNEAFVEWDGSAKLADGKWDYGIVKRTAHAVCPHCKGRIGNEHKTAMIRAGRWVATNPSASSSYVSRQLSSLYSTSTETTFGVLAVKFLEQKNSLQGLQGFINGDLAEPWESQDTLGDRVELVSARMELQATGTPVMTIDCQATSPFFWWVIRVWVPGSSQAIAAGSAETWEELEDIQQKHGVRNEAVALDSGYGARSDADVYATCVRHAEFVATPQGLPVAIGWVPTKGMPGRRMWMDEKTGLQRPYYLRDVDPFEGSSDAGKVRVGLVGFSSDYAKDILDAMRKGVGGITWSVTQQVSTETYWRHMDAEIKRAERSRMSGRVVHRWVPRAARWPNHLLDCEILQVIMASYLGLFDIAPAESKENQN